MIGLTGVLGQGGLRRRADGVIWADRCLRARWAMEDRWGNMG